MFYFLGKPGGFLFDALASLFDRAADDVLGRGLYTVRVRHPVGGSVEPVLECLGEADQEAGGPRFILIRHDQSHPSYAAIVERGLSTRQREDMTARPT